MQERALEIKSEIVAVRPDYKTLARALLDECRELFTDSDVEADFQRWKSEQAGAKR